MMVGLTAGAGRAALTGVTVGVAAADGLTTVPGCMSYFWS